MLAPGVPTNVADAIAQHTDDPHAFASGIVNDVMHEQYGVDGPQWHPAAAFDVFDLDPGKMRNIEGAVKALNDGIAGAASDRAQVAAIRDDARAVDGMVRFKDATPDMPWHADRPAVALYSTLASDTRLTPQLRSAAAHAADTVGDIVLAHRESTRFTPFDGSSYTDAVGPTVHFPISKPQIDPWAPGVSETGNRFFRETDAAAAERVVA